MDLSGPKIRTGPMMPGPGVIRFQPDRDNLGHVSGPGLVWLGPDAASGDSDDHVHLPVSAEWLTGLKPEDRIVFKDTRDKDRFVKIVECQTGGCWAHAFDRSFVVPGTALFHNEWGERPTRVGDVPLVEEVIVLKPGDDLILHRSGEAGEPARYDESGNLVQPAHISCTNPDVFDQVETGHRVLFDDGKIEGTVIDTEPGVSLRVRVLLAKPQGQKLRSDKGINFPNSNLSIRGLTQKDRDDLRFIVEHADVVNMSFVNTPDDVEDLLAELEKLGALHKIGVVLKIETRRAFDNLTELLLTAMRTHPVGVMIARGDLAVECGWQNIPMIQQEIQSFCRAAHVPDVWATQVLENLVKKGLPTRAELTDAAFANWAECVMLNKGTYVDRAIFMLDSILRDMRPYVHDKAPMFPPLPEERSKPARREKRLQQSD
jgi:pyruvate kinase